MTGTLRAQLRAEVDRLTRLKLQVETRCGPAAKESTYDKGCRCVDCKAAARIGRQSRRLRQKLLQAA